MSGKIAPLAFAVSFLCLVACGGGGGGNAAADNPPANNPAPQPSVDAQGKARFEASKVYSEPLIKAGNDQQSLNPSLYTANGVTISQQKKIGEGRWLQYRDYRSFPAGFASLKGEYRNGDLRQQVVTRSYQGFYSGSLAIFYDSAAAISEHSPVQDVYGAWTPVSSFPTRGRATYNGVAFDEHDQGSLVYHVDFANKKGYGEINGISRYGKITLHEESLRPVIALSPEKQTVMAVNYGKSTSEQGPGFNGYILRFAGNQAEEIAGYVLSRKHLSVGFHGTRGEITE